MKCNVPQLSLSAVFLQLALLAVKTLRRSFDWLSGYNKPNRGEAVWLK